MVQNFLKMDLFPSMRPMHISPQSQIWTED